MHASVGFQLFTIDDILSRLEALFSRIPHLPPPRAASISSDTLENQESITASLVSGSSSESRGGRHFALNLPYEKEDLIQWALSMRLYLEEFRLLSACIGPATYIWPLGVSESHGYNLSLLAHELIVSQSQLSAQVEPSLDAVLSLGSIHHARCSSESSGSEARKQGDVSSEGAQASNSDTVGEHLPFLVLAKTAAMIRQIVLSNMDRLMRALRDYQMAQASEVHDVAFGASME